MTYKPFIKIIVLEIGLLESTIVDEKHFGSQDEAQRYLDDLPENLVAVRISM